MKKKVVIGAAAVLLAALFIPVPKTYADGTKSYSAVAYKIIKRSSPAEDGSVYVYKDFYAFPSNFRASSKPEDVSEPAEEDTTAQVTDETENAEAGKTVPETEKEKETESPETTAKPTTTIPNTYVYDPSDSVHYVRLSWSSSADYPQVVFIRSKAQLNAFDAVDFSGFNSKYTQDYFKDHALIVVFTSESSGSNYYTGARINSAENEVVIDRYIPPVGTCDMASWAVIIEVPASDPILECDNNKTKVTFNNIEQ